MIGQTVNNPTIGRIVHYVSPGGEARPAIVTRVLDTTINLHVFADAEDRLFGLTAFNETPKAVPYSESHTPGTWHWPRQENG